jgi:hypothetical protein
VNPFTNKAKPNYRLEAYATVRCGLIMVGAWMCRAVRIFIEGCAEKLTSIFPFEIFIETS